MFVNEHFLTLIYRPTAGAADKAAHSIFSMFDKASPAEAEDDSIDAFTDMLRDAEKLMGRANLRQLRTYDERKRVVSGKSTPGRVELGGRSNIKKNIQIGTREVTRQLTKT